MPIFALTPKLYPAAYIRPILYVRTVYPKLFLDEDFVAGCVYNITPSFHKRNVSSIIQHNNIECCKKKDKNGPRTRDFWESMGPHMGHGSYSEKQMTTIENKTERITIRKSEAAFISLRVFPKPPGCSVCVCWIFVFVFLVASNKDRRTTTTRNKKRHSINK